MTNNRGLHSPICASFFKYRDRHRAVGLNIAYYRKSVEILFRPADALRIASAKLLESWD